MDRKNDKIKADFTPKHIYVNRRKILQLGMALSSLVALNKITPAQADETLERKINTFEDITNYNNFYEFGIDKTDPAKYAHKLTTSPWQVEIAGLVENPGKYALNDLLTGIDTVDRTYRLRCVEGWSMLIPWNGIQLNHLLEKVGIKKEAKYVAFETLLRPEEMHMQKTQVMYWPYREGLRLDEAMHPLTILAT